MFTVDKADTCKLLLVDDDEATLSILTRNLEKLGCEIAVADSSESGIEQLEHESYDAVFTALCVRKNGGRSLARWIKSNAPQTRCYIVTSWKGELEPELLHLDGIHGVIHKPLIFNELKSVIDFLETK
ncbi:MAG: response regulator [Chitinivibrionales bacterium]|nr:response regulator [Chitinivibrionales bacterium]